MKSCFDGYLTDDCKTCVYWKNNKYEIGCCCPFPIDHCESFKALEDKDRAMNEMSSEAEKDI